MYGLLGRKLGHSLSPQIHSLLGTCPYELFCREPDELADFFADETKRAFNVTIPYKVEAFNACGELSPTARRAGSVNTVVRRPDGTLYGDNTDYFGFLYMAESCGASFKNKKVVVLGSGGASRTVVTVSQDGGARETVVVSRSGKDNYENLSRHFDADILVNTTPVGMFPDCPKRLVDLSEFTRLECVLDLIYNPCRTQLLADAQELGIPCANGLKMLVAQAVRSAEVFTGKSFGDEIINDVYKRILSEQKNIVLIGMPGCGKTTAGKIIAEKTGRNFLDTDEEIEKKPAEKFPKFFLRTAKKLSEKLRRRLSTRRESSWERLSQPAAALF